MILDYMRRPQQQTHITDAYVSSPPALIILDERGDVFTLGLLLGQRRESPQGEFAFEVLWNGQPTGEFASRIERRSGRVRIFCRHGWKHWNGQSFT